MISRVRVLSLAALLCSTSVVLAANPPFTEHFAVDQANWVDAAFSFNLDYFPAGGPDGDGYISDESNFGQQVDGDNKVLFRGHQDFGASNGEFAGNWLTDGVGNFSAMVRHNAPLPLNYFARFASSLNFPGAIGVEFVPVLPNQWTEISFDIEPSNPQFISFEGTSFEEVFSNIGNVQIGVDVPDGFGGNPTDYRFDVDVASISAVPEPSTITCLLIGALVIIRKRGEYLS